MKKRAGTFSLKKKLFGFVGITSLVIISAAGVALHSASNIQTANLMKEEVAKSVERVLVTRVAEKTFLQFYTPALKADFVQKAGEVGAGLESLGKSTTNEEWKKQVGGIGNEFENYRKLFDELVDVHARQASLRERMVEPLRASEQLLKGVQADIEARQQELQMEGDSLSAREFGMLNVVKDCKTAFIQLQNLQLQFLISGDQSFIQQYKSLADGNVRTYLTALEQFASAMKNNAWMKTASSVRESLSKFLEYIEQSQQLFQEETAKLKVLNENGTRIVSVANVFLGQVSQSIESQKNLAVSIISVILLAGLLFFWGLSGILVRSITKPISAAILGLTEVSEQVGAASHEVSNASEELAEGASRQASAVEQTSSSLEEMASMTKQNAENADQANRLMAEAKQTIMQANKSMEGLTGSMRDISEASEQTQKIIKTIDEVAFQTNLLALNAAVEAARAGEAGAGFAVVAEEVRNLAKRAAEAAKNTAVLIETTVKTVHEGAGLVEKTNSEFSRVSQSAARVGDLVGEIAAASQEQAQGISQVNRAVAEMDKVIQQNAANAEESAAASRELSVRSKQMKNHVDALGALIGGEKISSLPASSEKSRLKSDDSNRSERQEYVRKPKEVSAFLVDPNEPDFQDYKKEKAGERRYLHTF